MPLLNGEPIARAGHVSLSNLHLPRGCRFLRGFFLSHVYLVSFLAPHQSMFWRLALTQTCASLSFIRLRFCVACRGGKKSRRSCKNLTHSLSFLPSFHDSISIPNPSKLASYKLDALSFLLTHARRVCGRDCALTCVCVCVCAGCRLVCRLIVIKFVFVAGMNMRRSVCLYFTLRLTY